MDEYSLQASTLARRVVMRASRWAAWAMYCVSLSCAAPRGITTSADGYGVEASEDALACLLSTSEASLQVEFDIHGCYNDTTATLGLRVWKEGAQLTGGQQESYSGDPDAFRVDQRLDRAAGEQLLRTLVDAAVRPEQGPRCQSTLQVDVRMAWSCGSGPFKTLQRAKFTGSLCSAMRARVTGDPVSYERAEGVFRAVDAVLEQARGRRKASAPGAHPGATR